MSISLIDNSKETGKIIALVKERKTFEGHLSGTIKRLEETKISIETCKGSIRLIKDDIRDEIYKMACVKHHQPFFVDGDRYIVVDAMVQLDVLIRIELCHTPARPSAKTKDPLFVSVAVLKSKEREIK
ncbi:MAG: hypothetical protein KAS32_13495 [Candidatus Peribacteraceae bacterium]|nr:hypothetical protein [Candidatus Peribacteraceae bacterium]